MQTPPFPHESATLTLDGPVGPLEIGVDLPDGDATARPIIAVICHPLSIEGGSMHNKVVTMAARSLRDLGIATVRFNFRSVGGSAGTYDNGEGEADDLRAVANWVRSQRPDCALWLAGFSFGSFVLLVQGDADEVVDAQGVYQWLESLPNPPQLVRMPDTSHFFHRKLIDLRGAIQHEVRRWLPDGSN